MPGFGFTDPDAPVGAGAISKLLPHLDGTGVDRLRKALGLPAEPTSWETISQEPESGTSELKILDIEPLYRRTDPLFSDHVTLDLTGLDTTEGLQSAIGEPYDDDRFVLKRLFPEPREISEYRIEKDSTRSPFNKYLLNDSTVEPENPDTYQFPELEHRRLPGQGLGDGSPRLIDFWSKVEDYKGSLFFDTPGTKIIAVINPETGLTNFVRVPNTNTTETGEQTTPPQRLIADDTLDTSHSLPTLESVLRGLKPNNTISSYNDLLKGLIKLPVELDLSGAVDPNSTETDPHTDEEL
jgi:hypothetical protein